MHNEGTRSNHKIFANIFIAYIGAGILGVPFAFKEAGVIEGIVILIVVGLLSTQAMLFVVDCKVKILNKEPSYQQLMSVTNEASLEDDIETKGPKVGVNHEIEFGDIGYYAIGKSGIVLVDSLVVLSQVGFCCAYLIFISENLSNFIKTFSKNNFLTGMIIPLVILTNVRKLHHLGIFSFFANCSNIFAYCIVIWFDFEHFQTKREDIHNYSAKGLPFFMGIAIYCYEGAGMILSLEASVARECRAKFYGIFKLTMVIVTALYLTFGICGYVAFGEKTKSIITLNLPNGRFPVMVKSCLCFSLFFTYPVMMFPVSRILEMRLFKDPKNEDYYKCTFLRSCLVGVTVLIVIGIPNFSTLMALIGSSCCILLALILPGVFHLKIFEGELTVCQKILDYVMIVLGIVGGFFGTKDAMARLLDDQNIG